MPNIVHLPRPANLRPVGNTFGFYVRVGRNDHLELLDLLAGGEQGVFGFVIDAHNVDRHRELMTEARKRNLDLVLDPKTQQMGLPGSHSDSLGSLPWALKRHHVTSDFTDAEGRKRAHQIFEFAAANGFTQLLGPTHLLNGPNDPWLRNDIRMMQTLADLISAAGSSIELIYPLAIPIDVFRKTAERRALISAIDDAPSNGIWLKVENFGDDSTGEKTAAYIEACKDFHSRGIPLIADHVGGLPGLGALAFGAVGGIAHGVTVNQNFRASSWRRPRSKGGGGSTWRVYIPQLDILMKPEAAEHFLSSSTRVKARCGCRDTHCCPHGIRDMIARPARHALYQRAREIETLSNMPQSVRVAHYVDDRVRLVSDNLAEIASLTGLGKKLRESFIKKQGAASRFRQVMVHLANASPVTSTAELPQKLSARNKRKP